MKRMYGIICMVMLCFMMSVGYVKAETNLNPASTVGIGVDVSGVYDYSIKKSGVRVETSLNNLGIYVVPVANITYVSGNYTRFGLGLDVPVYKTGIFGLYGTAVESYQETDNGSNGFGTSLGGKVEVDITKMIALTAGYERFIGQSTVKSYNGNNLNVGLLVKF